jgi:hypothetical protein
MIERLVEAAHLRRCEPRDSLPHKGGGNGVALLRSPYKSDAALTALHIQHQPFGLAAGATDHHPLVLGLLFLAQDRVVMLGDA